MSTSPLHHKIQEEIRAIPERRTRELYELLRQFRLQSRSSNGRAAEIMRLAGSWSDMSEDDFSSFCTEVRDRRRLACTPRCARAVV